MVAGKCLPFVLVEDRDFLWQDSPHAETGCGGRRIVSRTLVLPRWPETTWPFQPRERQLREYSPVALTWCRPSADVSLQTRSERVCA